MSSHLIQAGTFFTASTYRNGAAGDALMKQDMLVKKTGIADNVATTVLTVTIPNANHAAWIELHFFSSNGGASAFASSRIARSAIVVARTTGANAVATAIALANPAIATVAAGATHTLALTVGAVSGAVGAANTFDIQVTIDDSAGSGSNQCITYVELTNSESSGITIAAA